ncbi:hypothetical protein KAFR_0K00900 [Kazachstania africana CBS 2517]|uniref:37S ribosomal protein S35, mitochondrial n=1 Tax=Kazachstania africana (strain ATCC 22294 / BCRC 22015 / CBS 2517 / CECT 1963 / NBRC 1671 / NRRL Y-8276) TaxID=1071382 RepID=H2B1E6_KAZAF|nr:hypothetical protein KAFR_0K00900 [Kazachstania africana CBS 2517]CCF60446.1 hypothetical protein KAFR_0K00900 [Kazachstania africana CBS 2517]
MLNRARSNPVCFQQVRHLSRRKIAYPFYPFKKLSREHPKKHDSNLKHAMRQFLGPRNYKGEYQLNKYTRIPRDHVPNYISPNSERGETLVNPVNGNVLQETFNGKYKEVGKSRTREDRKNLRPFPLNANCQTNYIISDDLKRQIYNDMDQNNLSTQQISQKYGLKVPRVDAIIRLYKIEQDWTKHNLINPSLQTMSETLYGMFPIFKPTSTRENLSEIPIPSSAKNSRFVTIAESEPFGPIDAANVLDLEPAVKTLQRLSSEDEEQVKQDTGRKSHRRIILGELKRGNRSRFKFTDIRADKIAYRYGSGNRDNKKNRKIGFNEMGQMVYI